jgi:hypothetical protein
MEGPAPKSYFVFLKPHSVLVANNIDWLGHNRISSMGFTAISEDASCAAVYDDGSAEYALKIRDPANPSGWIDNPKIITSFISSYSVYLLSGRGGPYIQEYEGETVRLTEFPLLPSRFSCLFAFKSLDDCERAHSRHGWPKDRITSCRLATWPRTRTAKLSMDVVSILLSTTDGVGSDERKELWRLYWSGASMQAITSSTLRELEHVQRALSAGDVWEHLIEGQLIVDRESNNRTTPA